MKDLLTPEEMLIVEDQAIQEWVVNDKVNTVMTRDYFVHLKLVEAQLAKDEARFQELLNHRSRPELREKIAQLAAYGWIYESPLEASEFRWNLLTATQKINAEKVAAQIDALYPDEEEIRKDERERIKVGVLQEFIKLSEGLARIELPREMTILLETFVEAVRQGLKKGE